MDASEVEPQSVEMTATSEVTVTATLFLVPNSLLSFNLEETVLWKYYEHPTVWTEYQKIHAALARSFGLNGVITAVTHQVENIQGDDDTLSPNPALTWEDAEKQL